MNYYKQNNIDKNTSTTTLLENSNNDANGDGDGDDDNFMIEMTSSNIIENETNILWNDEYKDKYNTDIELYGFGIDHKHEVLKPYENNKCLKE